MNVHIENVAGYVTNKVYEQESSEHKSMKVAVSRLLEILLLNTGIMLSTYFISASLSILSIMMTCGSSYMIYNIIKKIYRDLRVDDENDITSEMADREFSKIVSQFTNTSWEYSMLGLSHVQGMIHK